MKTILLVEPGAKLSTFPPIGLLHVASAIRDEYDVVIKDYSGKDIDEFEVKKTIEKLDPYIVGIRVLTGPPIPRALQISKIAKEMEKIVVWGGPHPTILPEQTLNNESIDAVVIGEGEYSFKELIKYFEGKRKSVNGVGIKKNGKAIIMPPHKKIVDFKKLPMPAWDLLENINRYFPDKNHNEIPISTTRGCAFKCGFCHNSNKNVKGYLGCYRIAPPERAIKELRFVQGFIKNELDYLNVGEDLHLISYDYAKAFCKAVKSSGVDDLKWNTSSRYSMLSEKTIRLIARNNCKRIILGIESGSRRLQEINGKIAEFNSSIKLARLLRKEKIFLTNAYIFGHPTETVEEFNKTIEYIKNVPADENLIQLYRPLPGTPYFDMCLKEGKIKNIPSTLEEWAGFGVLGDNINVSRVPDNIIFKTFYKTNLIQQTKYWFNQERFFIRNRMYKKSFVNFIDNRFTFKLKEYLGNKKEAK